MHIFTVIAVIMIDFIHISKIVLFHRKRAGLSQKELADLAGVGKTVIYDIEQGKETVKFLTLAKVLEVLNITLELKGPLINEFNKEHNEESEGIL